MNHARIYLALLREASGQKTIASKPAKPKLIAGGCLLYQFPLKNQRPS